MFRGIKQLASTIGPIFGTRSVSSSSLHVKMDEEWYRTLPLIRNMLRGKIDYEQWEGRGLDKTRVTRLYITSTGLHKSSDKHEHFTARAFDDNDNAVWFFDNKYEFYTNGIHFYPNGLPKDLDPDRFVEVPSEDVKLITWCTTNDRNIKTGKKN